MISKVENHYNSENLLEKIHFALKDSGIKTDNLNPKYLAAVDQLHTGGAAATLRLLEKSDIIKDSLILDAGCGLGGSSRLIAKNFKCRVKGIDLSESFIETAKKLTCWSTPELDVSFDKASILELPFEDNSFDAVLCQHILMNIKDKKTAVKEFYRILKPDGTLIIHEILQNEKNEIAFPVPWATNKEISFLVPWEELDIIFKEQNFKPCYFSDETDNALAWWQMVKTAIKNKKNPSLGPHLVFGDNSAFFASNMQKNFQNKTLQCIEAILKKS